MYIPKHLEKQAALVGGIETTSKMPSDSWSLPAHLCGVGGKLNLVPGSVCHNCYALKGRYAMPNVLAANQRRFDALHKALNGSDGDREAFIAAMVALISKASEKSGGYFRIHSSGDLQSMDHLELVVEIAKRIPEITIWIPTKEYAIVQAYKLSRSVPANLVIRVSAPMVDGPAPDLGCPTSTVHDREAPQGFACPAPTQGGECGTCRKCWDSETANVSYHRH